MSAVGERGRPSIEVRKVKERWLDAANSPPPSFGVLWRSGDWPSSPSRRRLHRASRGGADAPSSQFLLRSSVTSSLAASTVLDPGMPALPLTGSLTARAPYTLLATSPSAAGADSSSAFVEKKLAHSRSHSLNGIGGESASTKTLRRRRLGGLLVATAGVAGLLVLLLNHLPSTPWQTGQGELQYTARHRIAVDFETTDVPEEWSCNPFKEPGRLEVDVRNKVCFFTLCIHLAHTDRKFPQFNNIWRPYDEACPPSRLMEGVVNSVEAMRKTSRRGFHKQRGPRRSHDTTVRWQGDKDERGQFYPWLVNATIVLLGA